MANAPRQMLTANRLVDGEVVYWRAGGWVEAFGEAEVFPAEEDANAALATAQRFVAGNVVVNPYLFELRDDGRPVKEREVIRALGPSVRGDVGKQADGGARRAPQKSETGNRKSEDGLDGDDDYRI